MNALVGAVDASGENSALTTLTEFMADWVCMLLHAHDPEWSIPCMQQVIWTMMAQRSSLHVRSCQLPARHFATMVMVSMIMKLAHI